MCLNGSRRLGRDRRTIKHFQGPKTIAVLKDWHNGDGFMYMCGVCEKDLIHKDDADRLQKYVQPDTPLVVECSGDCMAMNEVK